MMPLKIKVFLDGRTGHEKQTLGIVNALSNLTSLTVEYKKVKPILSTRIKNIFFYLYYRMFNKEKYTEHFDIIIGTGSYTHIPMLIERKKYDAKAVTCMTPELFLINKFDLCFIPQHDNPKLKKNIFITTGTPNSSFYTNNKNKNKGIIIVGGIDKKSHKWDSYNICKKIETVLIDNPLIDWTISSSPRTPEESVKILKNLAVKKKNAIFFDFKDTQKGWIEKKYSESFYVCLTADSISMIYEAVTSGCVVGIIPISWKKKNNKFQKNINYLIDSNFVVNYDMLQTKKSIQIKNIHLDEAKRCAKEILERWYPQRLK